MVSNTPVMRSEAERVWVITEWSAGVADYETGEVDADPVDWECRKMYSEVDYDALLTRCEKAEQAATIKAMEVEIERLRKKAGMKDEVLSAVWQWAGSMPPDEGPLSVMDDIMAVVDNLETGLTPKEPADE